MGLLFAFLGLFLGLWYGFGDSLCFYVFLLLLTLGAFLFSLVKKRWKFFLPCLAVGIVISLIPEVASSFSGEKTLLVFRTGDNYFLARDFFHRYYVSYSGHPYEVGDIIKATGTVKELRLTTYESRFDFGRYLNSWGVYNEFSLKRSSLSFVFSSLLRIRTYSNWCLRNFDSNSKAMILACLFNRKDYENPLLSTASSLNLIYLLSSSGIVASLLLRGLEKMLGWKMKEGIAKGITLAISLLLLLLSPFKIGLYRLFFSKLFTLLNTKYKWGIKPYERTSILGIAFLLCNVHLAYQSGFALGFGASLLAYFSSNIVERVNIKYRFLPRFALFHLFLFPVEAEGSGGFHLLSALFSYLLLPFALFYDLVGALSLLCLPLQGLAASVSSAFAWLLGVLSKLDLVLPLSPLPNWFPLLYYGAFFLALFFLEMGMRKKTKHIGLAIFGGIALSYLPGANLFSEGVYFLNVGQGDCIIIRDGLTTVMLDTGGVLSFDMAEEVLIPFLRKERIYKIDCLIASHNDFDHIGAKESLMANYKVLDFKSGADSFPLRVGNLYFENANVYSWSEENDSSLVLSLSFMGKSWVFAGDASIATEKKILEDNPDLPCDVLKVGHHGSDTSTSEEWLDALNPKEAIISCGAKNKYGHPHEEVINRLKERGITIRRTDLEGTIRYARFSLPWV